MQLRMQRVGKKLHWQSHPDRQNSLDNLIRPKSGRADSALRERVVR